MPALSDKVVFAVAVVCGFGLRSVFGRVICRRTRASRAPPPRLLRIRVRPTTVSFRPAPPRTKRGFPTGGEPRFPGSGSVSRVAPLRSDPIVSYHTRSNRPDPGSGAGRVGPGRAHRAGAVWASEPGCVPPSPHAIAARGVRPRPNAAPARPAACSTAGPCSTGRPSTTCGSSPG